MQLCTRRGFTLYEIFVSVLILALLGFLASPTFHTLINKSKEGNAKGGLATLRGALEIYHSDNEAYPTDDLESLKKKYLFRLPKNELPGTSHGARRHVTIASEIPELDDAGGWYYDNRKDSAKWGTVKINCTHTNSMSEIWSEL